MDFAKLDLKTASEKGSWLHLKYDGAAIYADDETKKKPSRLHIKGMGSQAILDAFRKIERIEALYENRLARSNDRGAVGLIAKKQDEMTEANQDMIVAAVDGMENIAWGDKVLDFSAENVLKICGPGTLFFKQVFDALSEERRLFTDAENG